MYVAKSVVIGPFFDYLTGRKGFFEMDSATPQGALPPVPRFSPAMIALVAANAVPLAGVLFWGWKVFDILFMYWCENAVIGFFNVLKMLACGIARRNPGTPFMVCFFIVHYGIFTAVHGAMIFALFGPQGMGGSGTHGSSPFSGFGDMLHVPGVALGVAALFVSHGVSFLVNFILRREYAAATLQGLMNAPYGRVIVLHLVVLLGGMACLALKSPFWALLLLVALKTAVDLRAHRRAYEKLADAVQTG
jgi:hypothetical protein